MIKETTVYGVGINDADYQVQINRRTNGKQKLEWVCPYFSRWQVMLWRCYSKKQKDRSPTYKGCSVSDEWLRFSNFKSWMESQDWEGKELDKDILVEGNKIYCNERCVFVDRKVNCFVKGPRARAENLLPGVDRSGSGGSYKAVCLNPFTGKREYLGVFSSQDEAHKAWRKRKHEHALVLSETVDDHRVKEALKSRYLD